MKTDLEKMKREAIHHIELSSRDKDSVVNADLLKMTSVVRSLAKKKDLVLMVFEK